MSLDKLNPALLRTDGASDGDALVFSAANARFEFGAVASDQPDAIRTPVITSPSADAVVSSFTPEIVGSVYAPLYAVDTRDYRQFQVDEVGGDFSSPVADEQANADSRTLVTELTSNTAFKVRIRDVTADNVASAFSTVVAFSTTDVLVNTPTLTVPGSPTSVAETPTLTTSEFSTNPAGLDTHDSTDWEIRRTSNSALVYSSTADSVNLLSISVPESTLEENTEYAFRARHVGTAFGAGEYAEVTASTLTTTQAVGISPAANEVILTNTSITLVSNEYVTFVELNHASTDWQIASDLTFANPVVENLADAVNLTSYAIPAGITAEGTMFWRVRYRDTVGNESNFSIPQTFVSVMPVVQPTGTSPSGGQVINTGTTITLTASAFSVTAGSTTHASSDWQVSTSDTFGTTIEESLADTVNLTSYSFTTATEATLFWRVRYRDSAGNVSGYSTPQTFESITPPPTTLGQAYGGGFYMGITTANSTNYYLIVAPNATGCAFCQWKIANTLTAGTTGTTDGFAHTYGPLNNAEHPAGNWTATRTIGGFSDWYMPAKNELNTLYINRTRPPAGEGFADVSHWSSTSDGTTFGRACRQFFGNSCQFIHCMTQAYTVRAVRRQPV